MKFGIHEIRKDGIKRKSDNENLKCLEYVKQGIMIVRK